MSTATARTLSMKFETDSGDTATISLAHIKDDVEAAEVKDAMDTMISRDIFTRDLTAKKSAQLIERKVTTLF